MADRMFITIVLDVHISGPNCNQTSIKKNIHNLNGYEIIGIYRFPYGDGNRISGNANNNIIYITITVGNNQIVIMLDTLNA